MCQSTQSLSPRPIDPERLTHYQRHRTRSIETDGWHMSQRILTGDGRELIGYTNEWSIAPGDQLTLFVSTSEPVVSVEVVRLSHGDPRPGGPGLCKTVVNIPDLPREFPGQTQAIASGSYAVLEQAGPESWEYGLFVWTALPAAGRTQTLLQRGDLRIFLGEDGHPAISVRDLVAVAPTALRAKRWTRFATAIVRDAAGDYLLLIVDAQPVVRLDIPEGEVSPFGAVTIAADATGKQTMNGKLEELTVGSLKHDIRGLRLVNAPTLAVTGRHWCDDETDFRQTPDGYAAVHFHDDDVEDVSWDPSFKLVLPDNLASGFYAFSISAGELIDLVPFIVRPEVGADPASIGYLVPTLTYLAYSNERLIDGGDMGMVPTAHSGALDVADHWLKKHPEVGKSIYDRHRDGSGVSLVSMRRPIPNLRPDFLWWNTTAPERLGADLYIAHFLDQQTQGWDAFTDHDLHEQGVDLLKRYPVIVTGTHPEYTTRAMLDALTEYLNSGGRMLYLGGNGFYWVTSIDPDRPYIAEIRRGINGTRAWSSAPGELRHQTTGELGGLWRYRNRNSNRLVGVGVTSQSDTADRAPGYRRTAAAQDPAFSWIFDGVSNADIIGDYGMYLGGAAGYEIDRHDPANDSPDEAVVLMTSQGMYPSSYLLVVEDIEVMIPNVDGPTNDKVRSDVVYLPFEGGGAVFSVGSCSWAGSLSHNGYDNDISRITRNVITHFLND